jgi:hypothetical protein
MRFTFGLAVVTVCCVLSGAAAPGTQHLGPFPSTSPDGGSCGSPWANDAFDRHFTIISHGGSSFTVREEFKNGTFVTIGGSSPGGCESTPHHGSTVNSGVTGQFQGFVSFDVTSVAYNPNGCTPTTCDTSAGFFAAVFPGGTASAIAFNFEYSSSDKSLAYRHWQDKSDQAVNDNFEGDIANF